jgi:hypothetical protein
MPVLYAVVGLGRVILAVCFAGTSADVPGGTLGRVITV